MCSQRKVTRAIAEGDTIGREVEDNAKALGANLVLQLVSFGRSSAGFFLHFHHLEVLGSSAVIASRRTLK